MDHFRRKKRHLRRTEIQRHHRRRGISPKISLEATTETRNESGDWNGTEIKIEIEAVKVVDQTSGSTSQHHRQGESNETVIEIDDEMILDEMGIDRMAHRAEVGGRKKIGSISGDDDFGYDHGDNIGGYLVMIVTIGLTRRLIRDFDSSKVR